MCKLFFSNSNRMREKKRRQFPHCSWAFSGRPYIGLQMKPSAAHTAPHSSEARISRQHVNGHDRLHAAIARAPTKSLAQTNQILVEPKPRHCANHGEAYLFPAAPPPRARRRRGRGKAPRAQASIHPRALRLHIPRRRRTAHQAAPRVVPCRQAPPHGGGPSRRCSIGGEGGWRGRWWRVHHQPQLLPEGQC